MHSSRMRTPPSLTVSHSIRWGGSAHTTGCISPLPLDADPLDKPLPPLRCSPSPLLDATSLIQDLPPLDADLSQMQTPFPHWMQTPSTWLQTPFHPWMQTPPTGCRSPFPSMQNPRMQTPLHHWMQTPFPSGCRPTFPPRCRPLFPWMHIPPFPLDADLLSPGCRPPLSPRCRSTLLDAEWHTLVKTLPCPKLRLRTVKRSKKNNISPVQSTTSPPPAWQPRRS